MRILRERRGRASSRSSCACCEGAGHVATQSSISRDLREIGVLKARGRYVLPPEDVARANGNFNTLAQFVRAMQHAPGLRSR